ncbi:universal stress protein [Streptomyces fuscigenes]|uniref:universal stress protein n=1 Tax=Streptomyces fuscigenes TaxID=1528880 RepID=UPI001F2209E5|nr:universal stress protein [Streptomyces fuscigenes]MCF3961627.1 universal stress protein [Streptomyces fuscigenes]
MSGTIVVGVDGSEPSIEALRWAARQAQLTGDRLEAVIAWEYPAGIWASMAAGIPQELDLEKLAGQALDEAVAKALGGEDAAIERRVVKGHAAQALVELSAGASLVVVGDRGHSGFTAALLGSVSTHVTQHAKSPVVVVRGR